MCRQASLYARQGETQTAQQSIATVRSEFGNAIEPEVAAWLMVTEGILGFYGGDADSGIGRLRRAHAIAAAIGNSPARPTCAAWLALSCLNARHFDEMVVHLDESLRLADADDHQARARASLVLADAFHFGGRFDLARPWYDRTRYHATKEGDESMISALLHNFAAFRAGNLRLADALGTQLDDEARRATMEAASAAAYDHAIGTRSLAQYIPHVTAQLLVIEKKYREALECLLRIDTAELVGRAHAVHYVDIATCALRLGDRKLLDEMIPLSVRALESSGDPDDVVYASSRLASIYESLGDAELATQARTQAASELQAFRTSQSDLVAVLLRLTRALTSGSNEQPRT